MVQAYKILEFEKGRIIDGRVKKKLTKEDLEKTIAYNNLEEKANNLSINLIPVEKDIKEGIIYSDERNIVYKTPAMKIKQPILEGISNSDVDGYEFWVPEMYWSCYGGRLFVSSDYNYILLNIFSEYTNFYKLVGEKGTFYNVCEGNVFRGLPKLNFETFAATPGLYISTFLVSKSNNDLDIKVGVNRGEEINRKLNRSKTSYHAIFCELTRLAREELHTEEQYYEWLKNLDAKEFLNDFTL